MNLLQWGITLFVFIEILNIMILYFEPTSTKGNGVGIFKAYEEAQQDEMMSEFVRYMVNWVAGAKLIFILIGLVVVIFGNYTTQLATVAALIISILSFYWRLYPSIKRMDELGQITPRGYYKTLKIMIDTFVIGFVVVFIVSLFL